MNELVGADKGKLEALVAEAIAAAPAAAFTGHAHVLSAGGASSSPAAGPSNPREAAAAAGENERNGRA